MRFYIFEFSLVIVSIEFLLEYDESAQERLMDDTLTGAESLLFVLNPH